ncbi:MAG: type VI secretion system membrane subunit TssM [endosymbiont of Galathealinum brachiosum]|uniref:Type VI secretion system membrane subunit TssM n=1 Tax=endosymbiont of Galathealinum brachiosum TaxID=2200906 RepID=A0A370DI44_9GAMM|nr:MAG: type VI secretion system membrane subunit TssM [endosymbiont of Galathealinum brachiosum]
MKKIAEFFKNKIVISLIGLIALSIIVWFIGPMIKFGDDNSAPLGSTVSRLVAIIVLVVIWGLNNLRIQMMNKKQNEELVGDLESNQESLVLDGSSDQTSEEMQQMNQRFSDALSTLKKLKFSGKGSKKALYELPWYIIIGPPGSGKTTALVHSSLDFPLAEQFGKGALQGIGGTRNCDWWFTNEAVLIDTAGRYTTQDSHKVVDSSAWEGFLQLLKRNRRRRPINGAIIAISIHDLLLQTEEERIQHAKTIRTRIDELMEKLEIRFPIYLMFTKADLASGFTEYFEDLGKEEREQVWGVSLPNAPKPSQSPDFDYLDAEYNKLLERLYSRELSRIHSERDVKRRAAIQGFPQQMENLKSVIDSFVKQTFVKNRFQFQPYLRGIYFTSGTQDGTPIDRMMSSVSSNFGFGRENVQLQQAQGKSFFLGNLFREVIFPESELVGSNRKYEVLIKWAQRTAYASIAVVTIGLLTVWAGSVTRHNMFMSEVESYIAEFNAENKRLSLWNKDLRVVLPTLNALAKASIVYDQDEHPWLSGMGLYDGNVDTSANNAYEAQLRELFLPRIINYLEKQIQKGHQGGDLYNSFRTYLMFNKIQYMDKQLISDWFVTDWTQNMQGEASKRKELELHLKALLNLELKPTQLNARVVSQTRNTLLRVPVHKRIYSRIRTKPEFNQKIDVLNMFGEAVRDAYTISPAVERTLLVPYMFTKEGYENIDLSTDSPVIADIVNERWVLSDDENARVDFVKDDLDEISERVKGLYMADYISHWKKVFDSLKIAKFTSIKQAGEVLASFTDPVYSPLLSILQVSGNNTQLSSQLMQNLNDDHGKGKAGSVTGFMANKFKGTKVDQQFRDMNVLLRESGKKPAPISSIVQKVQQLQDFLGEISVSPDPNKKAYQIAKARYLSGAGNAITSLRSFSKKTPEPVKRWLISISDETWKIILSSAHQYVNSEWKNQVYSQYSQALVGRYPLKRSSSDELALFDFSEFFKPGGTMDKFYVDLIKPFINTRKGWRNRVVDNHSLGLSAATLKQVRRAQTIKNVFFRKNPEIPGISFQLKPYRMDKIDARFLLEVGDQRITYNHGPKFWKDLHWSGEDENKRVRIVFEDLDEDRHERAYDGPWAWFKLQDRSKLKKTKKSNVYLVTYSVTELVDNKNKGKNKITKIKHNIKYLIKAKSVNNPFSQNLLGSFRCPSSI